MAVKLTAGLVVQVLAPIISDFCGWLSFSWLSGYGVVLLSPRTRVRFPAAATPFLVEAESGNGRVFEISVHVKDTQEVKIDADPSTTARRIACLASAR